MRILLIGGGSGGHITPLLAVAHELKALQPGIELIGVCERNASFVQLYHDDAAIDKVVQISAGKFRRYSGLSLKERLTDVQTPLLNVRDVGRTFRGYRQARRLLKELKPDAMLIKGGFVAVPMGLAASRLKIRFLTHDSDSVPGLANRIVSKWATLHATGMPAELYAYPKDKTVYTGVPVSDNFTVTDDETRQIYRKEVGLGDCDQVICITGGSQGGEQLNNDVMKAAVTLMKEFPRLGILHIAGPKKEEQVRAGYAALLTDDDRMRVFIKGFVTNIHIYTGASDVVVSRASATTIAELALQAKPLILVPGRLSGGHQDKNARYFTTKQAALTVPYGNADLLLQELSALLRDSVKRQVLSDNIHALAKPHAARELAEATLSLLKAKR